MGRTQRFFRFRTLENLHKSRLFRVERSTKRFRFRVLFAPGTFVSAVVGGGSFGNGENPCAATDFGRADRY